MWVIGHLYFEPMFGCRSEGSGDSEGHFCRKTGPLVNHARQGLSGHTEPRSRISDIQARGFNRVVNNSSWMRGFFILKTAVGREKAVQVIDVHREWKNCVATFCAMSQLFHFLGASRGSADLRDPTAVFRIIDHSIRHDYMDGLLTLLDQVRQAIFYRFQLQQEIASCKWLIFLKLENGSTKDRFEAFIL